MWGGGAFSAAWNGATHAAKTAVALIATGAKSIVVAAETTGAEVVKDAQLAAHAVAEAAEWAEKKTIEVVQEVEAEAIAAAVASAAAASLAMDAVETVFSAVVAGAAWVGCAVVHEVVKDIAETLAPLGRPLQGFLPAKPKLPHDGEIVGAGCTAKGKQGSGVLPICKNGKTPRTKGTITYINGIQTDYPTGSPLDSEGNPKPGICKTMQLLANATCAQVTGVYNATGGMATDIGQCLTNIAKTSNSPSVHTLEQQMLNSLSQDPPGMTIFAHSQGGLVTQEALARVKNDLAVQHGSAWAEQQMQAINIKSFGTAEEGWPVGPNYEQFTNVSDPVPAAIAGAQLDYPTATYSDNAPIQNRHSFIDPRWPPVTGPHSIDDTYIPEYADEIRKEGQESCCG
jgi:hypothetical protein